MTELDAHAQATLKQARADLSPSHSDQARVQARLALALAPTDDLDPDGSSASPPESVAAAPRPSIPGNTGANLYAAKLLALGASVGMLVGYQWGALHPKTSGFESASSAPPPATEVQAAPQRIALPLPTPQASAPADAKQPAQPPAAAEPQNTDRAPRFSRAPAQANGTVNSRLSPRSPVVVAGSQDQSESADDEEVFQMQRVERALRRSAPELALGILAQLDANIPHGRLLQERSAARILARCATGRTSGTAEVVTFERRYPESVYLNRLHQVCAK